MKHNRRTKRQLPDFRYWTVGGNTYYVPYYIRTTVLMTAVAIGMAAPVIVLAMVAWAFMA